MPRIKVGDKLPSFTLYEDEPDNRRNILELVSNKKAIIFGVPGAYVPGCSRVHLRGFIEKSGNLMLLGYQDIICVAVNDPFVLGAWGNAKGARDKVRMLADPLGLYTKAIGMDIEIPELGGTRSRRYSMATTNGIVRELYVDSPNVKLMCLHADGVPTYCTLNTPPGSSIAIMQISLSSSATLHPSPLNPSAIADVGQIVRHCVKIILQENSFR